MSAETEPQLWKVTCWGRVREVYVVEAATPEEAKANWLNGDCVVSEAEDVEPDHVEQWL